MGHSEFTNNGVLNDAVQNRGRPDEAVGVAVVPPDLRFLPRADVNIARTRDGAHDARSDRDGHAVRGTHHADDRVRAPHIFHVKTAACPSP